MRAYHINIKCVKGQFSPMIHHARKQVPTHALAGPLRRHAGVGLAEKWREIQSTNVICSPRCERPSRVEATPQLRRLPAREDVPCQTTTNRSSSCWTAT